ncbi:MAG TPA: hypothetical protein EYP88_01645 [Anaerolineales bacterium]|nr:hypothetical protein [Anaerolineales bacterium]
MKLQLFQRTSTIFALSFLLVFVWMWGLPHQQAQAAGQITTCTEAAFDAALSGGGAITFACDGTITFSGQKNISADTTIDASGQDVVLDGGGSVRLFTVDPGVSFSLNHVTLQNGNTTSGAAIQIIQGGVDLTIENSRVLSNTATNGDGGAIFADVIPSGDPITITIKQSIFENNQATGGGGAIFLDGGEAGETVGALLEISDSAFRNNQVDLASTSARGGAIYANYHVTVNIEGSVFDHNQAGGAAGAILSYNSPDPPNQFNLANNTFSNNSAGHAVGSGNRASAGAMLLTNANLVHNTFYGNSLAGGNPSINRGSVLYWAGTHTITLRDNIFHGNTNSPRECQGGSGSDNLTDDGSCNGTTIPNSVTNFDSTLGENGGPTKTHALQSSSNALDASSSCTYVSTGTNNLFSNGVAITRDQRGAARPYGSDCDKGAFELNETITQGNCSGPDLSGNQVFAFSSGETLTVTIGTANGLHCITVEQMNANHLMATGPGPNGGTLHTGNWWHITGNITDSFNISITLPYNNADNQSRVCKYPGNLGKYGWDCDDGTDTTYAANTSVSRSEITSFSDWAVGDYTGPTAVSLVQFAGHSNPPIARIVLTIKLSIVLLGVGLIVLWRIHKQERAP